MLRTQSRSNESCRSPRLKADMKQCSFVRGTSAEAAAAEFINPTEGKTVVFWGVLRAVSHYQAMMHNHWRAGEGRIVDTVTKLPPQPTFLGSNQEPSNSL